MTNLKAEERKDKKPITDFVFKKFGGQIDNLIVSWTYQRRKPVLRIVCTKTGKTELKIFDSERERIEFYFGPDWRSREFFKNHPLTRND